MNIWEYEIACTETYKGARTQDELKEYLNQYGQEGWELVTIQTFEVADAPGKHTFLVFKRPMPMKKAPS